MHRIKKIYESLISNKELSNLWVPITFDVRGNSKELEWEMSLFQDLGVQKC